MAEQTSLPPPLPRIHGPKLPSFSTTENVQIQFIESLGQAEDQDACVWEVEIEGDRYALKMISISPAHWKCQGSLRKFPFRSRNYCRGTSDYLTRGLKNLESYVDYYDPFNCECRVYGRLKAEGREDLAIQAYGYVLLTPEQEKLVAELETDVPEQDDGILNGHGFWERWEEHRGQGVRAIVKELVARCPGETGPLEFQVSHIPQMWEDLDALHSLGILVRDIHYANYLRGKLVDFSRAWTMYHPSLDLVRPIHLITLRKTDVLDLEQLIYDYWGQNSSRFPEDYKLPQGLVNCTGESDECGADPRAYNWMAREREEFVPEELFRPQDTFSDG